MYAFNGFDNKVKNFHWNVIEAVLEQKKKE
jgi:hypothetical protein